MLLLLSEPGYFIANLPFLTIHTYISGTTTWKECHEEDEDILVLDVDKELLEEMDSLLREMKL